MADTANDRADDSAQDVADSASARRAVAWTDRRVARLTKWIGTFSAAHGGAEGQVAYVGRRGARIVLVGADGAWGDLVAPSREIALTAVGKAGITLHDSFDGELAAKVRTGPYEWKRMAGIQLGGSA
ncbi:hypothetical protein [Streptomyces sp. NPDC047000]|uniref:hypothetical protein n=1 Tax=Streptomyces sp. NPDC047000 TaxID=3155474 RepID=UPI00340FBA11